MNLWQQQAMFSADLCLLIQEINKTHWAVIGEVERTAEQAALYAKEGKGIVHSLHCKKLAADIHLFDKEGNYITDFDSYKPFGEFWEQLDSYNKWGGKFPRVDSCHFQRSEL